MTLASDLNLQQMLTRERHRIHLIGVAGSGMSGIAALLLELGHDVSGSDKVKSWEVDRLQRLGLHFRAEHRAEDAKDAELVIYSSAIRETNPIRAAAALAGQPRHGVIDQSMAHRQCRGAHEVCIVIPSVGAA